MCKGHAWFNTQVQSLFPLLSPPPYIVVGHMCLFHLQYRIIPNIGLGNGKLGAGSVVYIVKCPKSFAEDCRWFCFCACRITVLYLSSNHTYIAHDKSSCKCSDVSTLHDGFVQWWKIWKQNSVASFSGCWEYLHTTQTIPARACRPTHQR